MLIGVGSGHAGSLNIVVVGASNTAGWGVGAKNAFPARLHTILEQRGIDAIVTSSGVIGDTTAGMLRRINRDVPNNTDIVILQPGTNDLRFFGCKERRAANISAIVDRLRRRDIRAIVVDPVIPRDFLQWDGIHFTAADGHRRRSSGQVPRRRGGGSSFRRCGIDIAAMINALHHVPETAMQTALREAARVIRPNGIVIIIEPLPTGNFFSALRSIEDETVVRQAAQHAIETAIRAGVLVRMTTSSYVRREVFGTVEEFLNRIVAVDPSRREIVEQDESAITAAVLAAAHLHVMVRWSSTNPSRRIFSRTPDLNFLHVALLAIAGLEP